MGREATRDTSAAFHVDQIERIEKRDASPVYYVATVGGAVALVAFVIWAGGDLTW